MYVAIHQPNYLPWLGYFNKIAKADTFIFLDNVSFSKGSYINRVKVLDNRKDNWLTIPVSVHFGDPINQVRVANPDWASNHLRKLYQLYRGTSSFEEVWPWVQAIYTSVPETDLARVNRHLIETISHRLGISCHFCAASDFSAKETTGDDRLIDLLCEVDPGSTYLSGEGGKNYQKDRKFLDKGLNIHYTNFEHPVYAQGNAQFVSGLSIIDSIFHLGLEATSQMILGNT